MLEQWTIYLDRPGKPDSPLNMRLYVKAGQDRLPVILFSHDSALHPDFYERILIPWASAGYMVIAPTHLDHDKEQCDPKQEWLSRLDDSMQVFTFLEDAARADLSRIVVAGHGTGAMVAHALGGASTYDMEGELVQAGDSRVKAIIALCPITVQEGFTDASSWDEITAPLFTLTSGETSTSDKLKNCADNLTSHRRAASSSKDLIILDGIEQSIKLDANDPETLEETNFEALANLNRYVIDFLDKHMMG